MITGDIEPKEQAWAGVIFFPGPGFWGPANLSSKETISFWTKGEAKTYLIALFTKSRGFMGSIKEFHAGAEWRLQSFPLADFEDIDPSELTGVFFGGSDEGEFSFRIDDVRFE